MTTKHKPKKTDKTSVHVKNTKTGVDKENGTVSLRWYHILATVVVISLAIVAVIKIFSHFDISLYGSKYTVKYAFLACTTSIDGRSHNNIADYHYAGVKDGDLIGKDGITDNIDDAYIQIVSIGDSYINIKTRDGMPNGWQDAKIRFGEEKIVTTSEIPDCMPGIAFSISK